MPRQSKNSSRNRVGVKTNRDPFSDRETEKYANPIASREFILEKLEEAGKPVKHDELYVLLNLSGADQNESLRRRLIAMSRDGQIIRNRKGAFGLPSHMGLRPGKVIGKKDGYGFFDH